MTSKELLPCPFCGSDNVHHTIDKADDEYEFVMCNDCGACISGAGSIEAWNMRSNTAEMKMNPDWDKAPEWAQYWAQNANGALYWYEKRPAWVNRIWVSIGKSAHDTPYPYWRNSLQQRPVDPYAELKAAAQDPTKQIRVKYGDGWRDAGYEWSWLSPPERYEIRDKPVVKTMYRRLYQIDEGEVRYIIRENRHYCQFFDTDKQWLGPIEEFTYEERK
jgi:hypothetical protein